MSHLVLILIGLYFLPTVIAVIRPHPNPVGLFIVNLLLGWSVVGYILCFVWSFATRNRIIIIPPARLGVGATLNQMRAEQMKVSKNHQKYWN